MAFEKWWFLNAANMTWREYYKKIKKLLITTKALESIEILVAVRQSISQDWNSMALNYIGKKYLNEPMRKKCQYSEILWSVIFSFRTEYGDLLRKSPYSVRMRKNMNQQNSKHRRFSRNECFWNWGKESLQNQ